MALVIVNRSPNIVAIDFPERSWARSCIITRKYFGLDFVGFLAV